MRGKEPKRAGRPCSFNRDQALDRAMHVFWQKGYEGASLHDLTTAIGIQPASLYGAFGNKQALFEQALARYLAGPTAFMRAALEEPTAKLAAGRILRDTAEFLTQSRSRSGCMTIQAGLVGGPESAAVRRKLIRLRRKGQATLRDRFERARSEGDLPPSANPTDLAAFITAVFQGMTVQAINGATREELLRVGELALEAWPA